MLYFLDKTAVLNLLDEAGLFDVRQLREILLEICITLDGDLALVGPFAISGRHND